MKSTSQSGFAIGAAIGILAILALLGGGAYVAKNYNNMASSTNATTTGGFELNANENAQMNANANATTSLGKDVSAEAKANAGVKATTSVGGGAGVNVNVNGGVNAGY